jgi:hypothetical protein
VQVLVRPRALVTVVEIVIIIVFITLRLDTSTGPSMPLRAILFHVDVGLVPFAVAQVNVGGLGIARSGFAGGFLHSAAAAPSPSALPLCFRFIVLGPIRAFGPIPRLLVAANFDGGNLFTNFRVVAILRTVIRLRSRFDRLTTGNVFRRQPLDAQKRVFAHHAAAAATAPAATRCRSAFCFTSLAHRVVLIAEISVGGLFFQLQAAFLGLQSGILQLKRGWFKRALLVLGRSLRLSRLVRASLAAVARGSFIAVTAITPRTIFARRFVPTLLAVRSSAARLLTTPAGWLATFGRTPPSLAMPAAAAPLLATTPAPAILTALSLTVAATGALRLGNTLFFLALVGSRPRFARGGLARNTPDE